MTPDRTWSQELRAHVALMGIVVEDDEIIPQAVKFMAWPQPPLTEKEIGRAAAHITKIEEKQND
jgi:hypothetical protein